MRKFRPYLGRSLSGWTRAWVAVIVGVLVLGAPSIAMASSSESVIPSHLTATQRPSEQYPCTPKPNGDYVHVSSNQASAHAWWVVNDCNEEYANVCISLQDYVDGWHTVTGATCAVLLPGTGGSGRRVTGKKDCASTGKTWWRSYITVETSGEYGYGDNSLYTNDNEIACRA